MDWVVIAYIILWFYVPSSWRFEAHAANAITYNDFTMAVLYMGNIYYWEVAPNSIKWS